MDMNYVVWIETKPRLLPRWGNFPAVFGPFHPVVCVLSAVRKGGARVDKEGGRDVFTTFGLARSQGINGILVNG